MDVAKADDVAKGMSFSDWKKKKSPGHRQLPSVPALSISDSGSAIVKITPPPRPAPPKIVHHVAPKAPTATQKSTPAQKLIPMQVKPHHPQEVHPASGATTATPWQRQRTINAAQINRSRVEPIHKLPVDKSYLPQPQTAQNKADSTNQTNTPAPVVKKKQFLHTPWIPKPQKPQPIIADTPELKLEKQRLWREYRHAMKPFKNREFHNAKRIIQRLSKKNLTELDEKELARLQRAQEQVAAHKQMIAEKTAIQYVRALEHEAIASATPGKTARVEVLSTPPQIYVRKPPPPTWNQHTPQGKYNNLSNISNASNAINGSSNNCSRMTPGLYGINFMLGGQLASGSTELI